MIEDCHRRFRDDALVEELIALLEKHVRAVVTLDILKAALLSCQICMAKDPQTVALSMSI